MSNPLFASAVLFVTGLVAGTLNVIAGGGSMLTLPVMIFLGLPPTVANGTNRVAILVQNVGASWSFHRRRLVDLPWLKLALLPALVGALAGAWIGVRVSDDAFETVLAVVMLVVAGWTLWHPVGMPLERGTPTPDSRGHRAAFALAFLLAGFYAGFIQAGVGFILLAITSLAGMDLVRGNALKVTLVIAFTPFALALYAWSGKVDWVMGAALAVGNFLGGQVGVRLTVLKGHAWLRKVVTVAIVAMAVRLLVVR